MEVVETLRPEVKFDVLVLISKGRMDGGGFVREDKLPVPAFLPPATNLEKGIKIVFHLS